MPTTQQGGQRALGYLPVSGTDPIQGGFDKHFGRAVCFITLNRNIYWWTSLSVNMSVDIKENTDACSPIKQYQVIREEPITLEIDTLIPGMNNETASSFVQDLRPGAVIDKFFCNLLDELFRTSPDGLDQPGRYGEFIIEQSNVAVNRDDFSNMRVTLRSLGYGDQMEFAPADPIDGEASGAYSEYDPSGVDPSFPS